MLKMCGCRNYLYLHYGRPVETLQGLRSQKSKCVLSEKSMTLNQNFLEEMKVRDHSKNKNFLRVWIFSEKKIGQ